MNGLKLEPGLKRDPDAITPSGSGYMDDDFYEDTGELTLPPKGESKDIWITRIPKWLYEAVSNYDELADGRDDDEIVIGEVLMKVDPTRPGKVDKTKPLRMFLQNNLIATKKLPQAFELQMAQTAGKEVLGNTYVFTEKDLPGYKPSGIFVPGRQGGRGNYGVQDPNAKVHKRSKYKKAVPKQTTLVGSATREYTAIPLRTKEYLTFEASRIRKAIQGEQTHTNIQTTINEHRNAATLQKQFASFVRPAAARAPQLNKAARIPRNELIDLLHKCFDDYQYWHMKTLRETTRQPESYLKEVLQDIAQLVRSGPYASTWTRQGVFESARDMSGRKQQVAPDEEGGGAGGGGDDDEGDEEMEMEDVI
ncbi:transcription initiation factor IIF [Westerdykella ornata]|uniref:Transcription initiation factor IIF subunit beta n=1 Tax=Westerdykella ornata TaxID=318751 RepID=A0A6A6J6A0_WESOR|nr:transcription initiation factor IIF [Westerdykella ornata]KAF2271955.1 transcription initiation factor IIF [Westerdykella ornata]